MGSPIDRAGRVVAGLIGYNPGPGIYSRLERAVEGMPANVRVEEIPGLLKRYKDGVPGWELKAADLDSVIAGRSVVPREELLSAVRERSPVYTHGELLLQGKMEPRPLIRPEGFFLGASPGQLTGMRPLGRGVPVGDTKFQDYGQGGDNYGELLLVQPGADGTAFGSHWNALPGGMLRARAANSAVAHARYDTHGDALRINELQSDLGIHNRKAREANANFIAGGGSPEYAPRRDLPFPLEDTWSDLLIKRLALEAARQGHRAIEIASPRAIADKVGGNIGNYEHFYGKVVPGAIERLGRKMGGLVDDTRMGRQNALSPAFKEATDLYAHLDALTRGLPQNAVSAPYGNLVESFQVPEAQRWAMDTLFQRLAAHFGPEEAGRRLNALVVQAQRHNAANMAVRLEAKKPMPSDTPRRYIMSDEMRKRILTQGIGASLLAPMAMEE